MSLAVPSPTHPVIRLPITPDIVVTTLCRLLTNESVETAAPLIYVAPWDAIIALVKATTGLIERRETLEREMLARQFTPADIERLFKRLTSTDPAQEMPWVVAQVVQPMARLKPEWLMSRTLVDLVREVTRITPWPIEYLAAGMLAVCGSCIGNTRHLRITDLWSERAAIWAAVIGEPGSYKTPALTFAANPLYALQAEWYETFKKAHTQWKADHAEWESRAANYRGEEPTEPKQNKHLISDITMERIVNVLSENPRGVLLERDELLGWVLSMNQYKKNGGSDRQIWLQIWSGKDFIVDRKTDNFSAFISHPFIGVLGGIQPSRFAELRQGADDGLVDRLLYFWPPYSAAKTEDVAFPGELGARYRTLLERLLDLQMCQSQPLDFDEPRMVAHMVRLAPDAFRLFQEREWQIRQRADTPEMPTGVRNALQKSGSQAARIALTLHQCQLADQMNVQPFIVNRDTMDAAWHIVECSYSHLERLFGIADVKPADERADKLVAWIRKRSGMSATVRELVTYKVAGCRKASEARALIEELADRHLGTMSLDTVGNREQMRITLPVEG